MRVLRGHFRTVQRVPQPMHGGVELPLDRAFRQAKRLGDFPSFKP